MAKTLVPTNTDAGGGADAAGPLAAPTAAGLATLLAEIEAETTEELAAGMRADWREITVAQARFALRQGEFGRRQGFLEEGATSLEAWTAHNCAMSGATARPYAQVGERSLELPELMGSFSAGEISFDKVRAVVDVATPESDAALCDQAKELSVRELSEVARDVAARARSAVAPLARSEHDARYARFSDGRRTISMQLPSASYAQAKATVDAYLDTVSSSEDQEELEKVPLDQRRCDGFMMIVESVASGQGQSKDNASPGAPKPFLVVAHVPLDALVDEAAQPSELAAELEHQGLIDVETVRRVSCDATVVVAVDDRLGHTMYEGRARRFPSGAQRREVIRRDRTCRFPGCANVTFAAVHHLKPWGKGGPTDLDNLVLLCTHHHGVVHRNGWSMTGNPDEELRIETPSGRVMVSRPSPLWARVTAGRGRGSPGSS